MIYKFRVILDAEEDIFRDIAIESEATLEDLHNAVVNAFGFDGTEMAAFYTCDDQWTQDEEIPLFDTGDVPGEMSVMHDFVLENILDENQTKIIYVYDFFTMWTFFVELGAIEEKEEGENYPQLLFSHGNLPNEAPETGFKGSAMSSEDIYGEFNDDLDNEDFDMFDGDDSFEDFGFDENWN